MMHAALNEILKASSGQIDDPYCTLEYVSDLAREALYPEGDVSDAALVDAAVAHLRAARELLKRARCPKAIARVRAALSSAAGARRSAAHRRFRAERAAESEHKAALREIHGAADSQDTDLHPDLTLSYIADVAGNTLDPPDGAH